MHAVISLLDEKYSHATKELWSDLEKLYGFHTLSTLVPFPHYDNSSTPGLPLRSDSGHAEILQRSALFCLRAAVVL